MKWNRSLILATVFAYLAATIASAMGYPALDGFPAGPQSLGYSLAAVLLFITFLDVDMKPLNFFLTCFYGASAMLSFSGIEQWINYYGTASLGPFMALWDLALAVALLEDF